MRSCFKPLLSAIYLASATQLFINTYCANRLLCFKSHHCLWLHTSSSIMADNRYCVDYAKRGMAGCKKCKQKIEKGLPRIAKIVNNPFTEEGGDMKHWHHIPCIFETFAKARATTKVIEDPDDLEGWDQLQQEEKDLILKLIKELAEQREKKGSSPKKKASKQQIQMTLTSPNKQTNNDKNDASVKSVAAGLSHVVAGILDHKDNSFREYRRLCAKIAEEPSYNSKTAIVSNYINKGNDGDGFKGDTYLLLKLLLPGAVKRVYNLQNKQLVKHFSQLFGTNLNDMVTDLEKGDVAETVRMFFEESLTSVKPRSKSELTLAEVDEFLNELALQTKEDDQQRVLKKLADKSTGNDLKMAVRLIKHDIRINAGPKHVLDGLDSNAYQAFQASRDLNDVVSRVLANRKEAVNKPGMAKSISVRASLLTPVLPMLAEACKSVDYALKKCPNGMYSEIKYDGERVQVHKQGDKFHYFSRSLKPVLGHKVQHFKDYIPQAFPHGNDLILDSEVLLIDTSTGKPLPFGTLGVHKKKAFHDANVCLFVFDCLHFNGQNLMEVPLKERRKFLHENMNEVPNRIMFSEMKFINKFSDLKDMMVRVIREGLEGLVLKDVNGIYEPGKRHWLKMKKDYLNEGVMADTADLVVLGAYYGTGNKGGLMSVFLMGVYDQQTGKWCTVTKCGNGHDDKTIELLNKTLPMTKISKDVNKVPGWLKINKTLVPDFVISNPKVAPVWEISGAEFSQSEAHTAGGISIRFPRVTRIREDKDWESATNLDQLKVLFKKSKETSDISDLMGGRSQTNSANSTANNNTNTSLCKVGFATHSLVSGSNGRNIHTSPKNQQGTSFQGKRELSPLSKKNEDPSAPKSSKSNVQLPSSVLPDVFRGTKVYIAPNVDRYSEIKRYIIAYNGDVLSEFETDKATHLVMNPGTKSKFECKAVQVTSDWAWDSIKLGKLQPCRNYPII